MPEVFGQGQSFGLLVKHLQGCQESQPANLIHHIHQALEKQVRQVRVFSGCVLALLEQLPGDLAFLEDDTIP